MNDESRLVKLPNSGRFPKVDLVEPTDHGFVLLALEIDHRLPVFYWLESRKKRRILFELKTYAEELSGRDDVVDATVFKTWIKPPGRGSVMSEYPDVPVARFDVVLLVECTSAQAAAALKSSDNFQFRISILKSQVHRLMLTEADNIRRMGPVDHKRDGIFLFNFFFADNREQNLQVWEYTAGWFQDQTGLDNSTLFLPKSPDVPYTIINHCRWDRARDIIPKLMFEPSFRSYVLKHFEANHTAADPILYRLA